MKNSILFLIVILASCHKISTDSLPPAINVLDPSLDLQHAIYYSASLTSLINVKSVFPGINAHDVLIQKSPKNGSIEVYDDDYLSFSPHTQFSTYDKEVLFISDESSPDNAVPISLIPIPAPPEPLECLVVEGSPTFLSVPLKFEIKKGEKLELDFLDLFCDHKYTGSGGVRVIPYEDFDNSFLDIHINPSKSFKFTANPSKNYTGTQAMILELCSGLPASGDFIDNPQGCNWFLYTVVLVKVVE